MPRDGSRVFRVGLLILAAIVVLGVGVFLIGEENNLFRRKNRYYIEFQTVGGLKPGNPVQLNGVDVGTVESVVLPEDPAKEQIVVWINVDRRYEERIRAPQEPGQLHRASDGHSVARIKTLGLLGDKFVELTSGSPEFPAIPSGEQIPSAQPTNVDALLASGEDVMDNVVEISASLSTILGRMERGEGLLGELTSDSPAGRRLRESMVGTFETVERIAEKVDSGPGTLPRLLNDPQLANRLEASMARLEGILARAETGPGLLPGLLNDPATKQQFDDTLATVNQVAQDLQGFTANLQSQEGLLPRLVNDEEYGREVTAQVQQIVERLNLVAERLTAGEGTAAKLINDPQIYEAVNDILIGIDESWLLRWLIRNRQKAGIEKRYEDRRQELEAAGQPVPPPVEGEPDLTPEDLLLGNPPPEPEPQEVEPPAAAPPPPSGR